MVRQYGGVGLRLRQVLDVRARERQHHPGLSELSNLGRIDEMKAPGPEPYVDDYPVEDVGLLIGEDMLDGADLVAVGADHRGAGLEAPIRNGVVCCHAKEHNFGSGSACERCSGHGPSAWYPRLRGWVDAAPRFAFPSHLVGRAPRPACSPRSEPRARRR